MHWSANAELHLTSSRYLTDISGIAGDTTVRSSDATTPLARIFDANRVQNAINAQVQITQEFSARAPSAVAAYADRQVKTIDAQLQQLPADGDDARRAQLLAEKQQWAEGGAYRVLMHTASGALGGNVAGAAGAAVAATATQALNDWQQAMARALTEAGMNATLAQGVAAQVSGLAAAGLGAAAGGATGAGTALATDANNRQLHVDERERISRKANGDKKAEERLTKAACYEVKCWAQFPEGSPLYRSFYVSQEEAAGLQSELAWVNEQKAAGAFVHTPFQGLTDKAAAVTGLSSLGGRGTFNGELISKPARPLIGNDCVTAECAAMMAPFRGHLSSDYISIQGNVYFASGGVLINLHDGSVFATSGLGRVYPAYSVAPGFSITVGKIIGAAGAKDTNLFLRGGGMQGSAFYPVSPVIPIGIGGGISYSFSGKTAVEIGIGRPGAAVVPASIGTELK